MPVTDPEFMQWITGGQTESGAPLTESTAMTLSAFYRGCMVISSSIAGLPLRSLRDVQGSRTRVNSMFDNPGKEVGLNPFNWKQLQVLHLILWGDAFLLHVYNQAGALVALRPIHPGCVKVEWDSKAVGGKLYSFRGEDGKKVELDATGITQIMGPSLDGLRGMSVLTLARMSLGGALSAEKAAGKMWRNGMLIAGMVSPDEDVDPEDAKADAEQLNAMLGGVENAGKIRAVNRRLKFTPWTMKASDAQFLESRQFGIQEVARWLGVPANLLMDPGAVSTWGTGVEIQNRGLARFTLTAYTIPMQEAYTAVIKGERFTEFDYAGLERGSPQEEINLLLLQVKEGVMSKEEFRHIRNMGPMDPAHTFVGGAAPTPAEPSPVDALRIPIQQANHALAIAGAIPETGALS